MKKFVVSILFLAILLPVASAQLPDVSNPGWSIGWEVEDDEVMMDLDDSMQFETKLKFWIDNTRPLPSDYDIEVEMTYPTGCDESSFSIDSESKVNVGAKPNESFEIKISGNGYGDSGEPCPTSEVFSLEVVVSDLIVAGQTGDGSKAIDQSLRFTPVYSLEIEFAATDNWNLADDIKSGTICINSPLMENIAAPFGGMKQSGIGREHGKEALDEFREAKHIFIDYKQEAKDWWF